MKDRRKKDNHLTLIVLTSSVPGMGVMLLSENQGDFLRSQSPADFEYSFLQGKTRYLLLYNPQHLFASVYGIASLLCHTCGSGSRVQSSHYSAVNTHKLWLGVVK